MIHGALVSKSHDTRYLWLLQPIEPHTQTSSPYTTYVIANILHATGMLSLQPQTETFGKTDVSIDWTSQRSDEYRLFSAKRLTGSLPKASSTEIIICLDKARSLLDENNSSLFRAFRHAVGFARSIQAFAWQSKPSTQDVVTWAKRVAKMCYTAAIGKLWVNHALHSLLHAHHSF